MKLTEKAFMAQVIQLAHLRGWMHYHVFDSRRTPAGFPDLVLVRETVLYVELKTDTGALSPGQQRWIDALALKAGQHVRVWRPRDWQEIEHVLENGPKADAENRSDPGYHDGDDAA